MSKPGRIVRIALLVSLVALVAWAIPRHPLYEEWHLSHLPLEQLERERGNAMDDFRLLYYTGLRLNERKRYADALPLLLQSARLQPDEARIRDALAQAQLPLGKTAEAFNQLSQYVGTHPNSGEGRLNLGKFYLAMKSGVRAREELERAVTLDPNLAEAWAALATVRSEYTPDKAAALDAARHVVHLQPQNTEGHLLLASLLAEQAAPETRNEFEQAVALAPHRSDIRQRYADFLLSTGSTADASAAKAQAQQSVVLDATSASAYLTLGRALIRVHGETEAVEPLTKAAMLDPYDPIAPRELAQLSRHQGHTADATRWEQVWQQRQEYLRERQKLLDAALAAPQDRPRSLQLARLLGRHGEVTEALRYQGIAQGKLSDTPSVLLATATDLANGGYAIQALPLVQRTLELNRDPSLTVSARKALNRIQISLSRAGISTSRPEGDQSLSSVISSFSESKSK